MNKNQELRLDYIKNILRSIIENKDLAKDLIFKGGTSLMLFYNLDRFSEDLDFNYLNNETIKIIEDRFIDLSYKYTKELTNFGTRFMIEYLVGDNKFHCTVDLNKYLYKTKPDLDIKNFAGKPIKVLKLEQNFAHKLCAFYERKKGRDVVDINFYMAKGLFPDERILKERHNKDFKEFLLILIKELQTPYLNERLSKSLDQLHFNNFNLSDYKNDIINNLRKNYTNNLFNFDLNYKEKLNKGIKIIVLDNATTLLVDGQVINNKIKHKYSLIDSKSMDIIYECKTLNKLFGYINNNLLREKLIIKTNNVTKIEIDE